MTNKPRKPAPDERTASENAPAMDSIRTKRETEAVAEKRKDKTSLAGATKGAKGGPAQAGDNGTDTVQNFSDEPIVEDEP